MPTAATQIYGSCGKKCRKSRNHGLASKSEAVALGVDRIVRKRHFLLALISSPGEQSRNIRWGQQQQSQSWLRWPSFTARARLATRQRAISNEKGPINCKSRIWKSTGACPIAVVLIFCNACEPKQPISRWLSWSPGEDSLSRTVWSAFGAKRERHHIQSGGICQPQKRVPPAMESFNIPNIIVKYQRCCAAASHILNFATRVISGISAASTKEKEGVFRLYDHMLLKEIIFQSSNHQKASAFIGNGHKQI